MERAEKRENMGDKDRRQWEKGDLEEKENEKRRER